MSFPPSEITAHCSDIRAQEIGHDNFPHEILEGQAGVQRTGLQLQDWVALIKNSPC